MKLADIIPKKAIVPQLKARDKKGALKEIVQVLKGLPGGERISVNEAVDLLMAREKNGSTGIGGGVAVPHAKLESLKGVVGALGRAPHGIDYGAIDGEPVHLIFLILIPAQKSEQYLTALRKISQAIRLPNIVKFLKAAKGIREIEEIFREIEEGVTI